MSQCPSCGGRALKYSLCGKCRADAERWRKLAKKIKASQSKCTAAASPKGPGAA